MLLSESMLVGESTAEAQVAELGPVPGELATVREQWAAAYAGGRA